MPNLAKLQAVQDETYKDMLAVLAAKGLCNLERPTGFGKTKLFMRYAARRRGKKMLYVYDTESARADIQAKYAPMNIEFLPYYKISRKPEDIVDYVLKQGFSAVVFDESHLMGGRNISAACRELIPQLLKQGCKVLGATATPVRTDLRDVTELFFHGCRAYEYDLSDAIGDGILIEPYWTAMLHYKKVLSEITAKTKNNPVYMDLLTQLDKAYAVRLGADKIYADTVSEVFGGVPDEMKFIVFCPPIRYIEDMKTQTIEDFKAAFPGHDIYDFAISSDKQHYADIVALERKAATKSGQRVTLIFAVNMLNQAYHDTDLTGIVMNRSTFSNIVFTQQLGRCLSVLAQRRTIVFDNVGNARIDPLAAINAMMLDNVEKSDRVASARRHKSLTLHVSQETIQLAEWYRRISATIGITQEQVDYARALKRRTGAPDDWIQDTLNVPAWLLNENDGPWAK